MGQIFYLPVRPPRYPDRAADMDTAECVLLVALRWWVADRKAGNDPLPRLCEGLAKAGASDVAFSVDRLMEAVARNARQPVAIHCPRCPMLSDDEKHLLHAASLAQIGDRVLAERSLSMTLVTDQGAECAVCFLEELGELFAEAGLFLQRRSPPAAGALASRVTEPWVPVVLPETIH